MRHYFLFRIVEFIRVIREIYVKTGIQSVRSSTHNRVGLSLIPGISRLNDRQNCFLYFIYSSLSLVPLFLTLMGRQESIDYVFPLLFFLRGNKYVK